MADFNITHNVILSFSPESAEILRRLIPAGDLPEHTCCPDILNSPEFEAKVAEICVGVLKQLSKHTKPEENSGKAEQPAPEAPAEAAPAPAPEKTSGKEITDADLRQAVKAAKDKVGTPVVKALFTEFNIPNSSACPQERRGELMDRLEKLAA